MFAAILPALGILAGMLICLEVGRWVGLRRLAAGADQGEPSATTIDGAIFALFGLIIAFTFSGATSRFETRRDQIAQEANAIGTAWLRIDLLPPEAQEPMRQLFRDYLRSRIKTYRNVHDLDVAMAEYHRSQNLQAEIWSRALPASRSTANPAVLTLVAQSLNDMFDTATTRLHAARAHEPVLILILLFALALASALVVGYESARSRERSWFRRSLFAVVVAICIFIILDLEHPRMGLVRIDVADRLLDELLAQMK